MNESHELIRVIRFLMAHLERLEDYVKDTDPLITDRYIEIDKVRAGLYKLSKDPGYDLQIMEEVIGLPKRV